MKGKRRQISRRGVQKQTVLTLLLPEGVPSPDQEGG